jgi:hypothetical protein
MLVAAAQLRRNLKHVFRTVTRREALNTALQRDAIGFLDTSCFDHGHDIM